MSYAEDMGHNIPNDEDYCGITDRYYLSDSTVGGCSNLYIECNTPRTIAASSYKSQYIFTFGKYKGKSLSHVKANDKAYIIWALENVWFFRKDVSDML